MELQLLADLVRRLARDEECIRCAAAAQGCERQRVLLPVPGNGLDAEGIEAILEDVGQRRGAQKELRIPGGSDVLQIAGRIAAELLEHGRRAGRAGKAAESGCPEVMERRAAIVL